LDCNIEKQKKDLWPGTEDPHIYMLVQEEGKGGKCELTNGLVV